MKVFAISLWATYFGKARKGDIHKKGNDFTNLIRYVKEQENIQQKMNQPADPR